MKKKILVGKCHILTSQTQAETERNTNVTTTRLNREVNENLPDAETKTDIDNQNTQQTSQNTTESFQNQ